MKLAISGIDQAIDVIAGKPAVVRIENKKLYSRVCQSLLSGKGEDAIEPYSVWDEDGKMLDAKSSFIVVPNPFEPPFDHKSVLGSLYGRLHDELLVDEEARNEIQSTNKELNSCFSRLGLRFNGDYEFTLEWDMERYLKAFRFGIKPSEEFSLLDNLIRFIDVADDMHVDETLVFVNLKTFLSDKDISLLYSHVFFHKLRVLLLENRDAEIYDECESKLVVDQHFIEYISDARTDSPSSAQGRFCSNGFGAVTF